MQTTRPTLQDYLRVFAEELDTIFGSNVVITGSNILEAHGLKLSWIPGDLDVAIYGPTKKQWGAVAGNRATMGFEPCSSYEDAQEMGITQRAWQKTKDGLTINFIFERNTAMPATPLYYKDGDRYWPVNTIATIVAAKLSYGAGKDKTFLRRKDAYQLSELKSLNFNITQQFLGQEENDEDFCTIKTEEL